MFARTFAPMIPSEDCASCGGVRVGAPPFVVEWNLPGGRDEVRAYAKRIAAAWTEFNDADIAPWLKAKAGKMTPEDTAMHQRLYDDNQAFLTYKNQIDGFDPLGPGPKQAWETLQTYETNLKLDRVALAAHLATKLKSTDPGELEKPGGADTDGWSIPWTGILIVGGIAATGYALSKASAFIPESSSPPEHAPAP